MPNRYQATKNSVQSTERMTMYGSIDRDDSADARVLEQSRDLLVCLAERRLCLLRIAGAEIEGMATSCAS